MYLFNVQRKLMQYLLSWCLVTWERSLLYKNSKQKLEPCSENVQFISSPVGWITVEIFFFFYKVTYCCRFLKGKYKNIQSLRKQFPCVLVVYSLCLGNQWQWCNGSFYIILVCHSHEESIVGAGEIDVLSKNSTDYRTDFPIYRAIFNSLPTAAASLRR